MASLGNTLEAAGSWKLLTGSIVTGGLVNAAFSPYPKANAAMTLASLPLSLGFWGVAGGVAGKVRGDSAKRKTRGAGTLLITATNTASLVNLLGGSLMTTSQAETEIEQTVSGSYGPDYGIN